MDLKAKVILTGMVGSHSYGLNTADSDEDYMSVVIPDLDFYCGLRNWGDSGNMRIASESPKVEHNYYELRKFLGQCHSMNPNFIPLLWLEPQFYKVITPEGQMLLDNRHIFNSKRIYHTFVGFAHKQLHKMGGVFNDKEEEEQALRDGFSKFNERATSEIRDIRKDRESGQEHDSGYLNALISLRKHSQEEMKRIKIGPITGRLGAARKKIREQYGFDTKFAYHIIRSMNMCIEFLHDPSCGLKVYRKGIDAEFLYSIREGKLTQEEVKSLADELFIKAKDVLSKSSLPDQADENKVHDLAMTIMRMNHGIS